MQLMDAIFDQKFMVTTTHRKRMEELPLPLPQQNGHVNGTDGEAASNSGVRGIRPYHFEQYENEAVFIPAGCPHQV